MRRYGFPLHATMLIGGAKADGDRRFKVFNPARPDEIVGSAVQATPDDIDRAVAAARHAQLHWATRSFTQRAESLARVLDRIAADVEDRAVLYVRENGKTLSEARAELSDVAPRARHTLALAAEMDAVRQMPAPNGRTVVRPIPFGVVVSIVPWNAPVSLAAMQIIPALLAGNAVVVKAPESCPFSLTRLVELMASELPPGLLNIVTGLPSEIGDALTTHPHIGKIAFTGSIPSARKIICNAAGTIKSVTSELGGNDPAILLPDADLGDETMRKMAQIAFRMTGQVCMAIKRIYVPDTLHDRFVEAFAGAVDRIVVGDGLQPGVTMGPLHTRAALDRTREIIGDAERRGGQVRHLGSVQDEAAFAEGYFARPAVVTEVPDDSRIVAEEQFCPAVPILRYHDVEDALARANATVFGLGGSIWGRDRRVAAAVASRLEAGSVFVNTHGTQSVNRQAPYGGLKQSGIGRRAGFEGLHEYLQLQTLTVFDG